MSDRVAIIGGATSGRDHFPHLLLPTDSGSPLPNTHFPFGFDIATICKIFYTVRRWSLGIDATWQESGVAHSGGIYAEFEPFILPADASAPYVMTREAEIVQYRATSWGWVSGDGYNFGGGSIDSSLVIFNESTYDDGLVDYAVTNEYTSSEVYAWQFFPDIGMFVDVNGDYSCRTHPALARVVGHLQYYDVLEADLTSAALDGSGNGLLTCDVQLFPVKFWPYAAIDTTPIWDEDTGEQLQDPLADYAADDDEETITQNVDDVPSTLVIKRSPTEWVAA